MKKLRRLVRLRWRVVKARWLDKPPTLLPDTLVEMAKDLRKVGLGGVTAGLVALFNPTGTLPLALAALLLVAGALVWAGALLLHDVGLRAKKAKKSSS